MIEPNEKLLPGNVVMCGKEPYKLHPLDVLNITTKEFYRKSYSSIPLTPEILVGWCGLKFIEHYFNDGTDTWQDDEYINVIKRKDEDHFVLLYKGSHIAMDQNLHSFQNLIYFLTRKDMIINIPN